MGCPNCRKEVTSTELSKIFINAKSESLEKVAKAYNKYMEYFSLNTCRKKAYFFAAASVEAGSSITTEENLNYGRKLLLKSFPSSFFRGKSKNNKWTSDVYYKGENDKNYQEHGWYATVERKGKTLYIQIEDTEQGYQNRIFESKNKWQDVENIYSETDTKQRSILINKCVYKNKNGNTSEDDAVNFRGSGLIQITGRAVFENVKEEIKNIIDKEIFHGTDIMSKEGSELVRANLELATLTGMGYLAHKKANMLINEFPSDLENKKDSDKEITSIWKLIGNNVEDSYSDKTDSYNKTTSIEFKVAECTAHQSIPPQSVKDVNIITYEIHYKVVANNKHIKKIIPKEGENKNPNYCKYVYIDKNEVQHELCVLKFKTIDEILKNKKVNPNKKVNLIDYVLDFKGYNSKGLSIGFTKDNSKKHRRYFVDTDCFAALLGAMCDENIDCISFNGASNYRGFPQPSVAHINGRVIDVGYVPKEMPKQYRVVLLKNDDFDFERQNKFNVALHKYGFARDKLMLSEKIKGGKYKDEIISYCQNWESPSHDNHLHIQGYIRKESIIDEQRK